eukprot:sb/3476905/
MSSGFQDGAVPHKEHFWERQGGSGEFEKYFQAMFMGSIAMWFYVLFFPNRKVDVNAALHIQVAEERLANGVLVDLFPDQKEGMLFVNRREMFPDHNPHTYDPLEPKKEYFWME